MADRRQDIDGTIAIPETSSGQALDVSGVDEDEEQKSAGVGDDMALPALHLFAGIITRNTAAFGGFDRLAVDHSGSRRGFAPLDFAQVHHQHRVDRIEQSGIAPGIEIAPDRRVRRDAFGRSEPRFRRSEGSLESEAEGASAMRNRPRQGRAARSPLCACPSFDGVRRSWRAGQMAQPMPTPGPSYPMDIEDPPGYAPIGRYQSMP